MASFDGFLTRLPRDTWTAGCPVLGQQQKRGANYPLWSELLEFFDPSNIINAKSCGQENFYGLLLDRKLAQFIEMIFSTIETLSSD